MINIQTTSPIIGIYKITSPSGKVYIGQSINIEERKKCYNRLNCKRQPKLYNSLRKYGFEAHIFEILEECPESYLNELETWWKLYYNSVEDGLNCGYWDKGGGVRSKETKLKISHTKKGISNIHLKGKKQSQERINNRVNKNKGKKRTAEQLINLSKPRYKGFGKKLSIAKKGKKIQPHTNKHKENISKSKLGIANIKIYKAIIQYDLQGNFIRRFKSIEEASQILRMEYNNPKISSSAIQAAASKKTKTSYKFKWEYEK